MTKLSELFEVPANHKRSQLKIFRIIARLNVGGPARHVTWLTQALNDDEFESVLVTGSVSGDERDMRYFATERGVEPIFIAGLRRDLSIKDISSLRRTYREIRKFGPDIVHTHTGKAGTVGRVAAMIYRWLTWRSLIGHPRHVRIVHTYHGHFFHSYYGKITTWIFLLIERFLARVATDRIVVISENQFEEIHMKYKVGRREQFHVIPLGIDLDPLAAPTQDFRREIGAGPDDIVAGFVGRLTEIKDLSLFLNAAAETLAEADRPPMRFVIAGDGHLRTKLEAEANSLGVPVHFTGDRRDPENIYAGLDIVVLTSLNEGTPLSLIEGMAAGKPFVATAVGGVRDLLGPLTEEKEGFIVCERGVGVTSRSPFDLKKSLIYVAKNERLRETLARNGLQFTRKQYSKDRLVADIKRLYRSL